MMKWTEQYRKVLKDNAGYSDWVDAKDFLTVLDVVDALHERCIATENERDALRSELDQLREQMRWRKYPNEKPEKNKRYFVRYLFSTNAYTDSLVADWISGGSFGVFHDNEWTVDSQLPLKKFIVTHFREVDQPPEEEA